MSDALIVVDAQDRFTDAGDLASSRYLRFPEHRVAGTDEAAEVVD
jgi:hypothetical protein